ncbi:porin family protein [Draconibacterium sp. IB214405]|uniref:porin family protein n=1 Tax=Draconibacterium sp. IB214405 TaxID=3097352 RepID=UPI002A1344CD|nr:porin family protein [Draconibacterium sp. IB214405]MDX8339579.1 porin family protein [Draconibacterium sp. IB214405]
MNQKTIFSGKRLYAILLAGVLTMGLSLASEAQVSYGFKLGAGAACQSDLLQIANNCDVRFSPSVGFITKYQLTEGFALKSGLEYQQKGRSFTENNVDVTNKLQYLTLPVKAEFSAGEKAGFKKGQRLYFAAGPYLSYMLDAEGKLDGVAFNLNSDTKDFDAGIGLELGMEFPVFNQKALQVGLNYDMGLVEVYKTEADLHNKMASISLGLLF